MNFISKFLKKISKQENNASTVPENRYLTTYPQAHNIFKDYLISFWNNGKRDSDFEDKSLTRDFNFNLVNLGELIIWACKIRGWSIDKVIDFTKIFDLGGDQHLTRLLTRLRMLSDGGWTEYQRIYLIDSGLVADRKEVLPIGEHVDKVKDLVILMNVLEGANNQKDHSGIDEEFGYVE